MKYLMRTHSHVRASTKKVPRCTNLQPPLLTADRTRQTARLSVWLLPVLAKEGETMRAIQLPSICG
jgi:hypothetical protein